METTGHLSRGQEVGGRRAHCVRGGPCADEGETKEFLRTGQNRITIPSRHYMPTCIQTNKDSLTLLTKGQKPALLIRYSTVSVYRI